MTERPILFNTEMVRAILKGEKTETRRIIKPQPHNPNARGISPIWGYGVPADLKIANSEVIKNINPTRKGAWNYYGVHCATNQDGERVDRWVCCPYGKKGDILWVRETWKWEGDTKHTDIAPIGQFYYKADDVKSMILGWQSSLFMPKKICRIKLEITNIRVERLNDISEESAIAEGVDYDYTPADGRSYVNYMAKHPSGKKVAMLETAKQSYHSLWESINGQESWYLNPFVWVIEFKGFKVFNRNRKAL